MKVLISRRSFLRSLLAAPFVGKAEMLMPVKAFALPPAILPGDLVNFKPGMWKALGLHAVCEPVLRIEGNDVITAAGMNGGEMRVPREWVSLFHGLPGNRVNNPSMRHRLVRVPGRIALAYPEDLRKGAHP